MRMSKQCSGRVKLTSRSRSPIPKAALSKEEAMARKWDKIVLKDSLDAKSAVFINNDEDVQRALDSRHLNRLDKSIVRPIADRAKQRKKFYLGELIDITEKKHDLRESLHHMSTWGVLRTQQPYQDHKVFSPYELRDLKK